MTPQELKQRAPNGATHYDIQRGKPIFFMKNDMGYTMRHDGTGWRVIIGLNINNYLSL